MSKQTSNTQLFHKSLITMLFVMLLATLWSLTSVQASSSDDDKATGIVQSMPSGLIGDWVIGGVTYRTTADSEIEAKNGPFVVGACVEVEYTTNRTPFIVDKLETEDAAKCSGSASRTPDTTGTPDASATPNATGTPGAKREVKGIVSAMPRPGLIGTWVIGGVEYIANSSTEFEQDDGPFMVGACVEVEFFTATTPRVAHEIKTEKQHDCSSGGTGTPSATASVTGTPDGTPTATPSVTATPEAELYGILQSFPADLVGTWNIGGMTFVADTNTEFEQENGAFATGMTVKVHFTVQNGVNHAREIETKFANDDDGNDDDGNGSFEGAEGHAFSKIDSFPTGLTGIWIIGGIEYTANGNTIFEQNDGSFAVGARVKVEYYLDSNGIRVAQEIETTNDDGGASRADRFKLFGFVNQMPPTGFVGTWVVDNIAFAADASTQFKENNALLGLGSFVAVEYFINNGHNQIHEVETHVPPGAGDKSAIGDIQSTDAVTAAGLSGATTWMIGGQSYVVNPATDLNEVGGALTVGTMALVNSYTAPNGSEVATQIRGVTLKEMLLLPIIAR